MATMTGRLRKAGTRQKQRNVSAGPPFPCLGIQTRPRAMPCRIPIPIQRGEQGCCFSRDDLSAFDTPPSR